MGYFSFGFLVNHEYIKSADTSLPPQLRCLESVDRLGGQIDNMPSIVFVKS